MARLRSVALLASLILLPRVIAAQAAGRPETLKDNSFFIEEAYNQDPGVVQHINTYAHALRGSDWSYSFTQEWPVRGMRHQLSAMIPVQQIDDRVQRQRGIGDIALNYRYQLVGLTGGRVAVAPRLSVILPTGDARRSMGSGGTGVQVNIPVSVELSEGFVTHLNAGATYTHSARDAVGDVAPALSVNVGQSVIWLATPTINLMLEALWTSTESVAAPGTTSRAAGFLLSPGVRWAYNLPHGLQVVPGLALPIGIGPNHGSQSLLTYLSFEHPF